MSQSGKSRFRQEAISCLLQANSIEAAAEKVGISKRTLLRWLQDENFREEYTRAKSECLKLATGILARNATRAAQTLEDIFASAPAPHQAARVAAAAATLRLALDAYALESLDERIRALEVQRSDD